MKFNLMPASDVEKLKFNEQVIRETAKQVIKDFASFGMEVSFPEDLHFAYDNLFSQLKPIISGMMQRNPEKLAALLYHIDIDESKTNQPGILPLQYHEWLSSMILEREFIKVLTRYYFKHQATKK